MPRAVAADFTTPAAVFVVDAVFALLASLLQQPCCFRRGRQRSFTELTLGAPAVEPVGVAASALGNAPTVIVVAETGVTLQTSLVAAAAKSTKPGNCSCVRGSNC